MPVGTHLSLLVMVCGKDDVALRFKRIESHQMVL